jgi:hypothetical protein
MAVVDKLDDGFFDRVEGARDGLGRFLGLRRFGGSGAFGGWLGFRFRFGLCLGGGAGGGDIDEFVCGSFHGVISYSWRAWPGPQRPRAFV